MTNDTVSPPTTPETAGLLRRLGAVLYDTFLLIGVWFVAAIPLAFTPADLRESFVLENLIRLYLIAATFAYFGWFWLHGGQTLGMRAWKIKLVGDSGQVTLKALVVRFIIATGSLGLGHLWLLFDKKGGALQDRLSHSRLLLHPMK